MEQLIILLAIGAISLVNWLIKQSADARERKKAQARLERGEQDDAPPEETLLEPQPRMTRSPAPQDEDPSESMRKLMEALGLPMENEPPKPVERPAPVMPPELPRPVYREPDPAPRRKEPAFDPYAQQTPPPVRRTEFREPEMRRSFGSDPAPSISLHNWNAKKPKAPDATVIANNRLRKMLSSPESLRNAIILAEVLGKPKALQ